MIRLRRSKFWKVVPPSQLIVIIDLYTYRNVKGFAWPKRETLADDCGVSLSTVIRALKISKACLGVRWSRGVGKSALTREQISEGLNPSKRVNCYYLPLTEKIDLWQPTRKKKRRKKRK